MHVDRAAESAFAPHGEASSWPTSTRSRASASPARASPTSTGAASAPGATTRASFPIAASPGAGAWALSSGWNDRAESRVRYCFRGSEGIELPLAPRVVQHAQDRSSAARRCARGAHAQDPREDRRLHFRRGRHATGDVGLRRRLSRVARGDLRQARGHARPAGPLHAGADAASGCRRCRARPATATAAAVADKRFSGAGVERAAGVPLPARFLPAHLEDDDAGGGRCEPGRAHQAAHALLHAPVPRRGGAVELPAHQSRGAQGRDGKRRRDAAGGHEEPARRHREGPHLDDRRDAPSRSGRNIAVTPGRGGVRERADPADPVRAAHGEGARAAAA